MVVVVAKALSTLRARMYVRRPVRRRRDCARLPTRPSPITANRSKSCARAMCVIPFPTYSATTPDNNQTFIRQHQVSTSPLRRDSGARARTHQVMNNSSMAGCTPALCLHVSCIWRSICGQASPGQGDGNPSYTGRARAGSRPISSKADETAHAGPSQRVDDDPHVPFARVPVPAVGHRPAHRDWPHRQSKGRGGATRETGRRARGFDYERVAAVSATSPARRACLPAPSGCGGDGEY